MPLVAVPGSSGSCLSKLCVMLTFSGQDLGYPKNPKWQLLFVFSQPNSLFLLIQLNLDGLLELEKNLHVGKTVRNFRHGIIMSQYQPQYRNKSLMLKGLDSKFVDNCTKSVKEESSCSASLLIFQEIACEVQARVQRALLLHSIWASRGHHE